VSLVLDYFADDDPAKLSRQFFYSVNLKSHASKLVAQFLGAYLRINPGPQPFFGKFHWIA